MAKKGAGNVLKINFLKCMEDMTWRDNIRNSVISRRAGEKCRDDAKSS